MCDKPDTSPPYAPDVDTCARERRRFRQSIARIKHTASSSSSSSSSSSMTMSHASRRPESTLARRRRRRPRAHLL
jgi:hypothetical protein